MSETGTMVFVCTIHLADGTTKTQRVSGRSAEEAEAWALGQYPAGQVSSVKAVRESVYQNDNAGRRS